MNRRHFITLFGGAAAWPVVARAQTGERMRHIGAVLINSEQEPAGRARIETFRRSLGELGWVEGKNLRLDIRTGAGDPQRAQSHARDVVGSGPEVIFAEAPRSWLP
jgi:putative tryptophan/tyrosine transport system substrate-binding protein